ncbi:MAG: MFS transporter [Acidobacteria bacterium]|nr:MFS transporter [Acidobacteriota bacterium]
MPNSASTPVPLPLTSNQKRGFWAAWAGWALDGMDSFIYALVMLPALRELLPRSGVSATTDELGKYGGLLFALFLVGWGCAFVWGPVADRFGRVRTLMLTVFWYSAFTFAGATAGNVWQLALFRLLAGMGIGGEWAMGGTLVAEEWPERLRVWGAALMHTGYYVGILIAAAANYTIGMRFGWRAMFALGGTPALFLALLRRGLKEPERWRRRGNRAGPGALREDGLRELFSPALRSRTLVSSSLLLVAIVGLWAGSVYVPASVSILAVREGMAATGEIASYATMLLAVATIIGCLLLPAMADRWGRRGSVAFYFLLMMIFIPLAFGYCFYLPHHALLWFTVCLFFLGVGGASFAVFTLWLPEQFPTSCRASGFAFATSVGRFAGAGITFLVGWMISRFHTLGVPIALTSVAFLFGLALLPLARETRGRPLPE